MEGEILPSNETTFNLGYTEKLKVFIDARFLNLFRKIRLSTKSNVWVLLAKGKWFEWGFLVNFEYVIPKQVITEIDERLNVRYFDGKHFRKFVSCIEFEEKLEDYVAQGFNCLIASGISGYDQLMNANLGGIICLMFWNSGLREFDRAIIRLKLDKGVFLEVEPVVEVWYEDEELEVRGLENIRTSDKKIKEMFGDIIKEQR